MGGFKDWVIKWILSMINGFDSNVQDAIDVLIKDVFSGQMATMANGIKITVTPVALTIITIVFLIEFLKTTVKMDILKWEYGLKVFFKFVLAKVAIDISYYFLTAIYATASEWIDQVGVTGGNLGATVGTAIETLINNMSWYEALALVGSMGISFLFIKLAGLIILVISYARMFELLVYIAVSPLPCAFLPLEDSRIPKKFFLSFAGVSLQGLFIIISIKLYQAVCQDVILPNVNGSADVPSIAFNMVLGALVLVLAVVKSGNWAKAILDAM